MGEGHIYFVWLGCRNDRTHEKTCFKHVPVGCCWLSFYFRLILCWKLNRFLLRLLSRQKFQKMTNVRCVVSWRSLVSYCVYSLFAFENLKKGSLSVFSHFVRWHVAGFHFLVRIRNTKPSVSEVRDASYVAFQIKTTNWILAIYRCVFARCPLIRCVGRMRSKRTRSFQVISNGIRVPTSMFFVSFGGKKWNSIRDEHMERECNNFQSFFLAFIPSKSWNRIREFVSCWFPFYCFITYTLSHSPPSLHHINQLSCDERNTSTYWRHHVK